MGDIFTIEHNGKVIFEIQESCSVNFGDDPKNIIVTDPTYIIEKDDGDKLWADLTYVICNKGSSADGFMRNAVVKYHGVEIFMLETPYSNGVFNVAGNISGKGTFSMETGLFCCFCRDEFISIGDDAASRLQEAIEFGLAASVVGNGAAGGEFLSSLSGAVFVSS